MKTSLVLFCAAAVAAVFMPSSVHGHMMMRTGDAIASAPQLTRVLANGEADRADEDCDDELPIAGDDDCDDDLPVAGDEDCDDDLPVAGDDDCDDDLPVAGDDCDEDLPVAGDDKDEYGGESDNINFDALQRGTKYTPGKAKTN